MAQNSRNLLRGANNLEREARKLLEDEYRAIALEFYRRVKLGTPADTGRARGNWGLTDSVPDAREDAPVVSVSEDGIKVIFLYNNLPYIVSLEMGSSKQAPAGFIRLAAAELGLTISGNIFGE